MEAPGLDLDVGRCDACVESGLCFRPTREPAIALAEDQRSLAGVHARQHVERERREGDFMRALVLRPRRREVDYLRREIDLIPGEITNFCPALSGENQQPND